MIVRGADTLSGRTVEISADLVVLATAVTRSTNGQVAEMLGSRTDLLAEIVRDYSLPGMKSWSRCSAMYRGFSWLAWLWVERISPRRSPRPSAAAAKVLIMFQRAGEPELRKRRSVADPFGSMWVGRLCQE